MSEPMRRLLPVLLALAAAACHAPPAGSPVAGRAAPPAAAPVYGYRVVHRYPHDVGAFTEGLFFRDGQLFESTGFEGRSSIRRVDLATGRVLQERPLDARYFGEGITSLGDRLYQLTWRGQVGFVYDLQTFAPRGEFHYEGEGWALTTDGRRLYMSDGTPDIRILDPATLAETGRIHVTAAGAPLPNLNELEWVRGEIFANVWMTDRIARIDPATGTVRGWIDLSGLLGAPHGEGRFGEPDVLNGVAYDAKGDRLFVTGKNWPWLYEIKLTPPR